MHKSCALFIQFESLLSAAAAQEGGRERESPQGDGGPTSRAGGRSAYRSSAAHSIFDL